MFFPESEKLLAKAPSKEETIRELDNFLAQYNGKVVISSHAAFQLEIKESELYDLLELFLENEAIAKVERAKCPSCADEIIESDFSPGGKHWHCCHCGGEFRDREVEKMDCFSIRTIAGYIAPHTVSHRAKTIKEGSILDKEALAHGRIRPWKCLDESEYLVRNNQLNDAAQKNILENLEKRGFCLLRIEGLSPTTEILTAVERFLGPALENQNGALGKIKEITPKEAIEATTGDSAKELLFHTDGTQEPNLPPAILVFQYLTTPKFGARSTFLDLASVIQDMDEEELEKILTDLALPDAGTSTKKGLSYSGPLVKPVRNSQSLTFRLRFDHVLTIAAEAQNSFESLKNTILSPDRDHLSYAPQEGDIAIFDNWRIMHGRDAVGGPHLRFHNRMWIRDLKQSIAANVLLGVRGLSNELLMQIKKTNQSEIE